MRAEEAEREDEREAERRLLDMLAGWVYYASNLTSEKEVGAVADLYSQSANIDPNDMVSLEQIEQFIITKVIPLVLHGVK